MWEELCQWPGQCKHAHPSAPHPSVFPTCECRFQNKPFLSLHLCNSQPAPATPSVAITTQQSHTHTLNILIWINNRQLRGPWAWCSAEIGVVPCAEHLFVVLFTIRWNLILIISCYIWFKADNVKFDANEFFKFIMDADFGPQIGESSDWVFDLRCVGTNFEVILTFGFETCPYIQTDGRMTRLNHI